MLGCSGDEVSAMPVVCTNSGHKTAAAIDEYDKSDDGVFLTLFLY